VLVTIDENGIPQDSKVISVSANDAGGQLIKAAKTFGFDQAEPDRKLGTPAASSTSTSMVPGPSRSGRLLPMTGEPDDVPGNGGHAGRVV
jgi:hypothetical protein